MNLSEFKTSPAGTVRGRRPIAALLQAERVLHVNSLVQLCQLEHRTFLSRIFPLPVHVISKLATRSV